MKENNPPIYDDDLLALDGEEIVTKKSKIADDDEYIPSPAKEDIKKPTTKAKTTPKEKSTPKAKTPKAKSVPGKLKTFNGKHRFGNAIKSKITNSYVKQDYAIKADCHFTMPCPVQTFRDSFDESCGGVVTPAEFTEETPVVHVRFTDSKSIAQVFGDGKIVKTTTVR